MSDSDEEELPSPDQKRQLDEVRHAALEPLYKIYLEGRFEPIAPLVPSTLELIPSTDLRVVVTRSNLDSSIQGFDVRRKSDPGANNFMGYDASERCLAFRGESRHFDTFLDVAKQMTNNASMAGTFKAPADVQLPEAGIVNGLTYQEFVNQVEIVEYIMWVEGFEPNDGML